ncbi:M6 family metalloprotease domain-containing protein [Micromonospora sp. WMMD723]|uniref:M6 family metalloprotease domain-containing protein n=1 Tax=Micromonospora sp. WMMD723 TaxID=3403465 RepID=UPI003CE6933E
MSEPANDRRSRRRMWTSLSVRARTALAVVLAGVLLAPAVPATAASPAVAPLAAGGSAVGPARSTLVSPCQLPTPATGWQHEGPTNYATWLPPSGTVRGIVLFVDFTDAAPVSGERTSRTSMFSAAPNVFTQSSYGALNLQLTFDTAWRHILQPHGNFAGYKSNFTTQRSYVAAAVAAANAAIDFSSYQIVYVVPPKSATTFDLSPTWVAAPGGGVTVDGVELRHAVTFGQDVDYWGHKILNHETGHLFGLPDLYSYNNADSIHRAVGGWDLMGLISASAPDLFAWHKWKAGWLTDSQVDCRTTTGSASTVLTPLGTAGGTKAVVVHTGGNTAVVVENRQVSTLDVASGCFQAGVLVYRVTTAVFSGGAWSGGNVPPIGGPFPVEVVDRTPGSDVTTCSAEEKALVNATLTTIGHTVTYGGVTVQLTNILGNDREVSVTVV